MTLFSELNRFVDVTDFRVRADPEATRTRPPMLSGDANRRGFKAAVETASAPGLVAGSTIYVPPGRYMIEADADVLASWRVNIHQRSLVDATLDERSRTTALNIARKDNPFGASLRFPEGTTLWLAPGAVLVPARGCIVEISSLLVCEPTECFDLSLGGLVVFGRQVPSLRPEWWGAVNGFKAIQKAMYGEIDEVDASGAIQSAIDAAIGNRNIRWPIPGPIGPNGAIPHHVYRLPPLQIELRGYYFIGRTLEVRADAANNEIIQQLNPVLRYSGASPDLRSTTTIIRGAWAGRQRQGATLIAGRSLGENPILRLTQTAGLSINNIIFSTRLLKYQPCVEVWASTTDTNRPPASQAMEFSACFFEGANTPLVQVGPRAELVDPPSGATLPYALRSNQLGADFSLLTFDGCDFHVLAVVSGGVAVDMRANQTFSTRFRRCEFRGYAAAMLSLWNGTHFLEGCRFDNRRLPSTEPDLWPDSDLRGLELPDNSDVFLRVEYPSLSPGSPFPMPPNYNYLAGFTALGCVSRSHRFLSTVSPNLTDVAQGSEWPVLLLNLRHRVVGRRLSPSVRWGMQHHVQTRIDTSNPAERRMGRAGPLVVVGGSLAGEIRLLPGALHSAVLGARVHDADGALVTPGYRLDPVSYRPSVPTTVFGLRVDQPASIRAFYGR